MGKPQESLGTAAQGVLPGAVTSSLQAATRLPVPFCASSGQCTFRAMRRTFLAVTLLAYTMFARERVLETPLTDRNAGAPSNAHFSSLLPRCLWSSAGASRKTLQDDDELTAGARAFKGLLAHLGQFAKDTTAALRRTVHRGLSVARQTDTFKSLKYAVKQERIMTTGRVEHFLSGLGSGLKRFLASVDVVHPAEREVVLPELLKKRPNLVAVLFKYAGLEAFTDAAEAFRRLQEFLGSFNYILKLTKEGEANDDLSADSNEDLGGAAARVNLPINKADDKDEGQRNKRDNAFRGDQGYSYRRQWTRGRTANVAESGLKMFEREVGFHLAFLADILTNTPGDTEVLKQYARRMLPRLKDVFGAAWSVASTTLTGGECIFHLRYLTDYLNELSIIDVELGYLSSMLPPSRPPFDPESYYYGTPTIGFDE
ncbi:hypothetical protein BESB_026830 [Besnoitia besnoiti]|uniref:Uncharacterized protein n=1 Tax=Besnoitia besnoiti TaxID=94643 RepID=A0A2A9M166_BESBE|nr:uncharacterized protein BESB_026830 [Besnoitia besnoiti]PFH31709.1 hypothetical protein BESB_026830 [Besnoitia besnoiti]